MRRIVLTLLSGMIALSAVEWEIEHITNDPAHCASNPVMFLDSDEHAWVLFTRWDKENGDATLEIANNRTGSWVCEAVDSVEYEYFFGPYYSFDRDSQGNIYVAFCQFAEEYLFDLYFATDTGGEFVTQRLANDGNQRINPVLKHDEEGKLRLAYMEYDWVLQEVQVRYGWFDEEGFGSELATNNVHQDDPLGIDLVFTDGVTPNILYVDDDFVLCKATRSASGWESVEVNCHSEGSFFPSAVADDRDIFHIAYRAGEESIRYITNPTGPWKNDIVVPQTSMLWWHEDGVCIAVDPEGNPYIMYAHYNDEGYYDLSYARSTETGWVQVPFTTTPDQGEYGGCGHYFTVDSEGCGHIVYEIFNEETEISDLYYAKSKQPLNVDITERPFEPSALDLEIRGSSVYFSLSQTSIVRLDLYDAAGREVKCIASGIYESGEHSIPINASDLSSGVYFARIEAGRQSASAKFILIH